MPSVSLTLFALVAEPQPDCGVRCWRGHQDFWIRHIDGIHCADRTSMALTLHGLSELETKEQLLEWKHQTRGRWWIKQAGYLPILSLPDNEAVIWASWDKMTLGGYSSNHNTDRSAYNIVIRCNQSESKCYSRGYLWCLHLFWGKAVTTSKHIVFLVWMSSTNLHRGLCSMF